MSDIIKIIRTLLSLASILSCLFFAGIAGLLLYNGYHLGDCLNIPVAGIEIPVCRPTPAPILQPTQAVILQPAENVVSPIIVITATSLPQQPIPTAVIVIQPSAAPALPPPSLPAGYISVGSYYSGRVNSNGQVGNQMYSHFISGKVKYTRISADDDVAKVEMVCTDNIIDITSRFFPIPKPEGEIFPNYASEVLEIPSNCRIDFFVVDTIGLGTGITVYAEAVP
jgi:hypothetical protein